MYTPLRWPMPASYTSSTTRETHFSWQMPQPVHRSALTWRARWRIRTWKLPTYPETSSTSLYVWSVMFGWLPTSFIFGVRMHAAQSRVGNVLSNWAMWPPIDGSRSTRWTGNPASASSSAVVIPAIPPPTTSVAGLIGTRIGSSGTCSDTR